MPASFPEYFLTVIYQEITWVFLNMWIEWDTMVHSLLDSHLLLASLLHIVGFLLLPLLFHLESQLDASFLSNYSILQLLNALYLTLLSPIKQCFSPSSIFICWWLKFISLFKFSLKILIILRSCPFSHPNFPTELSTLPCAYPTIHQTC